MNEQIILREIDKTPTSVEFHFSCTEGLRLYFNLYRLQIDYKFPIGWSDKSLLDVPDSILVLPFLGNILPISWLLNARVCVPDVDLSFYNNLAQVKEGFARMYPNLQFKGELCVDRICNNQQEDRMIGRPICFFSGGVDAWQTLLAHYTENPILLTMFGADFFLTNRTGIDSAARSLHDIATRFQCELSMFSSNLRAFINEASLNEKFAKSLGFHWWHRIQHGLGVITHAGPLAYLENSLTIYFASSYSSKDKNISKCATDPSIDNHIHMANSKVCHDGYEYTRQDKIYNICNFSSTHNIPISIHVCWKQYADNHNCSVCEKCQRTWMAILAEGFDPNDFGFKYEGSESCDLVHKMLRTSELALTRDMWEQIIYRFKMNAGLLRIHPELKWIFDFSFSTRPTRIQRVVRRIKIWFNLLRCIILSHLFTGERKTHYLRKSQGLRENL